MLASSPMFTLWTEVRRELEDAADEIQRLRDATGRLEARVRALEGEDA
jgi:ubiquinone biosynthesis protein UbiJ